MTHIDFALRQASPERRRATLPLRRVEERGLLGGVVIGDGQCHQLLQGDAASPVVRHQAWRDVRQFQAALHHQRSDAEVGGDILDGAALLDQRGEGLELVGRVHLLAQQVLREADGAGRGVGHQQARHLEVGGDALLLRQQLQGRQAAVAGHHLVMLAIGGEDDDKVLQQADAGNARGQLVDGQARRGARVALGAARQELRERQQDQVLGRVGHFQCGQGDGFGLVNGVHGDSSIHGITTAVGMEGPDSGKPLRVGVRLSTGAGHRPAATGRGSVAGPGRCLAQDGYAGGAHCRRDQAGRHE
ncbi:hypothetical protein PAERUG_P52_2_London_26_VIM_2_02_13_01573 [Pseudomonas aeruginosa]|nr:hypothetical protein PAERUG_P52_2_London_26_VIM_2_02_13_01573 [Pseudomonas aeruginosa]